MAAVNRGLVGPILILIYIIHLAPKKFSVYKEEKITRLLRPGNILYEYKYTKYMIIHFAPSTERIALRRKREREKQHEQNSGEFRKHAFAKKGEEPRPVRLNRPGDIKDPFLLSSWRCRSTAPVDNL